jgi:hypothetical protein
MQDWWNTITTLDKFFVTCATGGGFAFVLSMIMHFLSGDVDTGDLQPQQEGVADSDASFKFLSFMGVSAFAVMFGAVGIAMTQSSQTGAVPAILAATVGGVLNLLFIKFIFKMFIKLQSEGKKK